MILEHAILPVLPGHEADFEAAFEQARPLVANQPDCRSVSLSRSLESPNLYLLLIEWDSVEAHTDGFRTSREYASWKTLLHHFYDPFPAVEHFTPIIPG